MGKPPRDRIRISEVPGVSHTPGERAGEQAGRIDRERSDDNSSSSGTGENTVQSSGSFPSANTIPPIWGAVDGYHNDIMTGVNVLDAFHSNFLEMSLPSLTPLDFGDDLLSANPGTAPISTLGSPEFEGYSTSVGQTKAPQTQVDESIYVDSEFMPPEGSKGHDCCREGYDILRGLSFHGLEGSDSISRPAPNSASTTTNNAHRVPLDHILRLNRESIERLGRLLACSCARCPHLALLYASIISRVMIWYQQAAGCTQRASWSPDTVTADTALCHASPFGPIAGSLSPWASTTGDASSPSLTGATALDVAPTRMAMGSFVIDDQEVQTALRIQLLLGEIRRTGNLIDLFTSRSSSGVDEFTFSGVDSLYKILSSWLRREHSRVTDIIRSRLKEIST